PGGWQVSGRWGFASGCNHADVMVAGCIPVINERPEMRPMFLLVAPAASFAIEDTWQAHGLAGSGSNHYSVKDLFVPDGHHVEGLGMESWSNPPLSSSSPPLLLFIPRAGPPLGIARHAIDHACTMAEKTLPVPPPPRQLKDLARVRLAIARAEML